MTRDEQQEIAERFATAVDACAGCGRAPYGALTRAASEIGCSAKTLARFARGEVLEPAVVERIRAWLDEREAKAEQP